MEEYKEQNVDGIEKSVSESEDFLPYHQALGEEFRDRAKAENWGKRKSQIALAILNGALPEIKKYDKWYSRPDRKGGGSYQASTEGFFVGDLLLEYGEVSGRDMDPNAEARFAIDFFAETNNEKAKKLPALNAKSATEEELRSYVRKLQEMVQDQKKLEIATEIEEKELKAKNIGNKTGHEFIGTRFNQRIGGITQYGFVVGAPGIAGRKVLSRLKNPDLVEGQLTKGWTIWVSESDLDRLEDFFVPNGEDNNLRRRKKTFGSQRHTPVIPEDKREFKNNPFEDLLG